MPKIKWNEDFSVQNKDIDNQHKKLIEIYNKAHDRMMDDRLVDSVDDIGKDALREVIEYTKYHFSFEEKFMEKIEFQEIEEHKRIHKDFVRELDHLALQMDQGTFVLASEIIKMIENWIVYHILNEDQKYAK